MPSIIISFSALLIFSTHQILNEILFCVYLFIQCLSRQSDWEWFEGRNHVFPENSMLAQRLAHIMCLVFIRLGNVLCAVKRWAKTRNHSLPVFFTPKNLYNWREEFVIVNEKGTRILFNINNTSFQIHYTYGISMSTYALWNHWPL